MKDLENLEQFEEAVKTLRDDLDKSDEVEKVYKKGDKLFETVSKVFGYWKTGWFLIMVKYAIDIETAVGGGYRVIYEVEK